MFSDYMSCRNYKPLVLMHHTSITQLEFSISHHIISYHIVALQVNFDLIGVPKQNETPPEEEKRKKQNKTEDDKITRTP